MITPQALLRKSSAHLTLKPFQVEDHLSLRKNNYRGLVANSPGTGKAQPLDAPILTPAGWRPIGELQIGDTIVDPDGGNAKVLGVYPQGVKDIYRVTFDDGSTAECCDDHLWLVRDRDRRNLKTKGWAVVPLHEIRTAGLRTNSGKWTSRKWSIPLTEPVTFDPSEPLLIDPYLLGALIGDGSVRNTTPRFSTADPEILERVSSKLPEGYSLNHAANYDYTIAQLHGTKNKNVLRAQLEQLGLYRDYAHEKHIPLCYLRASVPDRIEMLRGLMDTDGTVSKGVTSFTTSSPQLAADVVDLIRNLGGTVTQTTRIPTYTYNHEKRDGRRAYTLFIRLRFNPFYLERKAKLWKAGKPTKGIESIEFVRRAEAVCIAVDSRRNLYVTTDYTVTHNTILVLACIRHDRKRLAPAVIIAPASVVSNWVREAQKWLPGVKVHLISDTSTRLPRNPHDIYVISWALLTYRVRELRRLRPRFIVGDEIHYCKSEETQRSMALRELSTGVPHMILMSGTPIVNNLNELENIKAFFNQPNVLVIRRLLEDVQPDIPPKTRATLPIRLRDEDARQYRKAEEDFADWLENELRKRMSEGEALTSAQRALSAEALVKTGYLRRLLGEAKVPAAVDWIARAVRIGEPVVVFCEHQNVVEMMQRSLNNQHIQYVTIDGSTGREERQNAIDSFQAGRVPVFIGTKAAKEGITLVRARHLLFLERFWTSADEEQAEDRIRRIGQTRPTMIWFLHAVDTIDDRIAEIIAAKRKIVADNLGSSTIEERDEEAVIDLIETWGESTISSFDGQELDLGIGKPPPPMPTPTEVCTLIFRGDKYTVKSAMAWALLHGYLVKRHSPITGGVQLHIHDPSSFAPGKFKTIPISKDIKALVGMRKGHSTRSSPRPSQPKRSR